MSRIDNLIAELCPEGVEHRTIGEIGALFGGLTGKSKGDFSDGNARYASYKNIFSNLALDTEPQEFVRVREDEKQNRLRVGDVVFTGSSESASEVGMSSAVTNEPSEPLYLNSFCFGLRPSNGIELLPGYAKHVFRSSGVRRQIVKSGNGVTRINVSKDLFRKVKVPIPPPAIQREIVEILDMMEALQVELESELELRSRQYAHYRDVLIGGSAQESEWQRLSGIGSLVRGRRFTKADYAEGGIPAIHYGHIYTHFGTSTRDVLAHVRTELDSGLRYANHGDVIIAGVSETVEDVGKAVAWLGVGSVAYHDDSFRLTHEMDPRFVSYALQTAAFHEQKERHVSRGKMKRLSAEGLGQIRIPVPPIVEQERIADVLDDMEALVNDLSAGLPAEIEARRQQYEHYRDRLLTFKLKDVAA